MKRSGSTGRHLARLAFLLFLLVLCVSGAKADRLTIVYTTDPHQIATAQAGALTVITFTGSVMNNTSAPITFQLTGGPVPFEPYVVSFLSSVPFPGIALGPGMSTGTIDLATVTLNFFDPSLTYPGTVKIVLAATDPKTGSVFTENDASITVLAPGSAVPEPASLTMLTTALAVLIGVRSVRRRKAARSV